MVPPAGEYRLDEGHCVVVDGLVSEEERQELLDWLTAPGHDHSGPPPSSRWEQACVDRAGDQPTWGLKPDVLEVRSCHRTRKTTTFGNVIIGGVLLHIIFNDALPPSGRSSLMPTAASMTTWKLVQSCPQPMADRLP